MKAFFYGFALFWVFAFILGVTLSKCDAGIIHPNNPQAHKGVSRGER